MAKTQYSLSTDPALKGRPEAFDVPLRDVTVSAGAGFVVVLTGDIMTMPGLPKVPAAESIDIDENGEVVGLFLMHSSLEQLLAHAPVVTNGAWGTQLQARGLPIGGCPDLWNLRHPERVEEVARAYVEAGSQIVLTNTFGANRFVLQRHGAADRGGGDQPRRRGNLPRCRRRPGQGLRLDRPQRRDADDGRHFRRPSCSPPLPSRPQAMAEAGADGLVIETMSDPAELRWRSQRPKPPACPSWLAWSSIPARTTTAP